MLKKPANAATAPPEFFFVKGLADETPPAFPRQHPRDRTRDRCFFAKKSQSWELRFAEFEPSVFPAHA
jgi:hypothetical protein